MANLVFFLLCMISVIVNTSRALHFPRDFYNFSPDFITIEDLSSISPSPSHSFSQSPPPTPATSSKVPVSDPLVPAFFVIGDSSVDSGTNNFLGTFARADHLPYGRDFDTHQPTGRFCNGRIPVDYLALRLGLPFVPSYLGQTGSVEDMIQGVNYASAGAGIIFSSGSQLGQRISLTQQIQQFTDTYQQFILNMGEDSAANLISNSVFYLSIGINDYIHYYLPNISDVQNHYLPWSFNQFLALTVRQELKNLYNMNVRKVVLMGMAPIGCAPHYLWKYNSENGECVEDINDMIMEFNFVMKYMVDELRQELPDANIIFCDMYQGSMDIIKNHERYGFNATTEACCGLGKFKGWILCLSPEMACSDASSHIWWDQFHPTDAVNAILADNVWNGLHTKMCYPINLEDMVAPNF
ncbi:GDSL esterase/lipase [Melia azedarach]|uniref:GDSL esterase/lipase n=1 Tax=Melia azedarach TaxID=155640 RepID=A0ACC1XMA2_MELAZ|nr:GDSL esterase/lipase [Melia azedarach]